MFSFMKKNKSKKGFTLIELLVVIAIIGVLASVVLASLNTARRKSRDARRIADIKQIQLALELYFDAQSSPQYPASGGLGAALAPTYIPTLPADPLGTAYRYCRLSTTSYHLAAALEDSSNTAKNSDRDLNTSSCTGGDTINGTLEADNTDANCASGTGRGACYDVTN